MERIIWLLTYVPATILLVATGGIDFYLLSILQEKGVLEKSILSDTSFLAIVAIVVLILAFTFAVIGWNIGWDYVEMGRSRRWHYRANKFDDYNDQLRNSIHWAGKFACFPIILGLVFIMACELFYIV